MSMKSIVIASPQSAQRNRLRALVDRMHGFEVIACTGDLMNTYNEVEERLPKAVLIADVLADLPEFEVMRALFSTLDIRWLVITSSRQTGRFNPLTVHTDPYRSDLFSIPGDAPEQVYLQQLSALTCTNRRHEPTNGLSTNQDQSGTGVQKIAAPRAGPVHKPDNAASLRPNSKAVALPGQARTSAADAVKQTPVLVKPAATRNAADSSGLILIGASTGGVDALLSILTVFPEDCPPTLVVQHTGAGFGESLAGLLNRQCRPDVRLADDRCPLEPGTVVIGAGIGSHLTVGRGQKLETRLEHGAPVAGHVPSVDVLFGSAVHLADRVSAALLTGMGRDGANGMKALHDAGAYTIAQDEASCVVYGMPRAAVELGAVRKVLPLHRIATTLLAQRGTRRENGKELQQ